MAQLSHLHLQFLYIVFICSTDHLSRDLNSRNKNQYKRLTVENQRQLHAQDIPAVNMCLMMFFCRRFAIGRKHEWHVTHETFIVPRSKSRTGAKWRRSTAPSLQSCTSSHCAMGCRLVKFHLGANGKNTT